jgi:hypothetical protein
MNEAELQLIQTVKYYQMYDIMSPFHVNSARDRTDVKS